MGTVTAHSDDIDPAPAGFADFYRETVERTFRIAYLVAHGDHRIAREATQHAYERLLRRWERHELLDIEDKQRHITGLATRAAIDRIPEDDDPVDDRGGPHSTRELIERQPVLRRAVAILFFREDYSAQEIAGMLDVGEPEILADIDRVRVMLKPIVDGGRS